MDRRTFNRRVAALALSLTASAVAVPALAQSYPSKPVRLIVPYPPGGVIDVQARSIVDKLGERLGQTVVIENLPGASGIIGTQQVKNAQPDGYTLLMGYFSPMAVHPSVYPKLPYDPVKDFAPIGLMARTQLILVVHPSLPVQSVKELVELVKSKPDAFSYGATGSGSGAHLAAELLKARSDINMVQVSYKGSAPALMDLQANNIQVLFDALPSALPLVRAGKLRALAVTDTTRAASAPEVPTLAESGYPTYRLAPWTGILAPRGTPAEVVHRLNTELKAVMAMPEVRQRLAPLGVEAATSTPEEFGALIRDEMVTWGKVVKDANIKAE